MADNPERQGFLRVPVRLMPFVAQCLHSFGAKDAAKRALDFMAQYTDPVKDAERRAYIERGVEVVGEDGELEIDDDCAYIVAGPDADETHAIGAYVLAWVWVDNPNWPEGPINQEASS